MAAKHLRDVPLAGMNMVLAGAAARGFTPGDPAWVNLGQGQPEIGDIPGAPPRITRIALDPGDHAYGPVNGIHELRDAVAAHYNRLYRAGKRTQYGAANVAIVGGGRPALNRAVAALGHIDIGYLRPDYAAYEDILDRNAPRIRPVGVTTPHPTGILDAVTSGGLPALLVSNPRNPTGEVLAGDDLRALVVGTTAAGCALLVDEFYSHYVYEVGPDGGTRSAASPVSAAAYVDDVDTDPVVIFDGLTKNFRYPGWRLGWIVGPVQTIAVVERVGQALDGGPSQVVQRAALAALDPGYAEAETTAVRSHFAGKRDVMVDGLRAAG
ncbi:MAG TPA: pyridoxal phosphate-dependent aminotransferase, partial [Micromonosporaceae bacterium]